MARYEMKTWPSEFGPTWDGACTHTIRRMDRPFMAGDHLLLREYDQGRDPNARFTGRSLLALVTYVSAPGSFWLPDDVCVMSLRVTTRFVAGERRALSLPREIDPVAS